MLSASAWGDEVFTSVETKPTLRLVGSEGGEVVPIPVGRWHGRPGGEEMALLTRARGPVLDVGCGPGRHVSALIERAIPALGIDVAPAAVRAARRRGAPAVQRSVFADAPPAERWMTVLLLDGNIGIGGEPIALLRRCAELLDVHGVVLAELDPPGVSSGRFDAWVEHLGRTGPRFAWARVGPGQIAGLAARSGFTVNDVWEGGGRWFAQLNR